MFRRVHKPGRPHRWMMWTSEVAGGVKFYIRSCRCGAIQRHNVATGETTIWLPDGVDSGLLDKGITRQIYEKLDELDD